MNQLIFLLSLTLLNLHAQNIKILPYSGNPGLFLEELGQAKLLEHTAQITTIINTTDILRIGQNVSMDGFYNWSDLAPFYRNFTKNIFKGFLFINKMEPTNYYNISKELRQETKDNATKSFEYDAGSNTIYVRNSIEDQIDTVFEQIKNITESPNKTGDFNYLFLFLHQMNHIVNIALGGQIPDFLFEETTMKDTKDRMFWDYGLHLPELEDEYGSINCDLFQIHVARINQDLYFEIRIPIHKRTLRLFKMHSLPTFYPFNDTFIRNEITTPGQYVGVDGTNQPVVFYNKTRYENFEDCRNTRYLILHEKSHQEFKCISDIISRRTLKNCPTHNDLNSESKFSETKNGVLFSTPKILEFNFTCNDIPQPRQAKTLVGRIEFPKECSIKLEDKIFYGGESKNNFYYPDDLLEIGNLTKFIGPPANLSKIPTPTPNYNKTPELPIPKFSPEILEKYKRHMEITVGAGSFAILALSLASIGALCTVASWYKSMIRRQPEPTYIGLSAGIDEYI